MSLQEQIDQDLTAALKSGDSLKRETLRLLKSSLKNAQIEQGRELNDDEVTAAINKEIKRRKEAIESYNQVGKPDLAKQEEDELTVLKAYLPEQMSEEEIRAFVSDYLTKNPADPGQIGRTIGALSQQLKGKADMAVVARVVKELSTT